MYERHVLGKQGEDMAVEYLQNNGYKILERNFFCKQGEIDVIALDKDYIVFIEIKTRSNTEFGLPSEAVTERKIKHILKTTKYYLYTRNLEDANIRIDAIEIYIRGKEHHINHIKQII